MKHLTWTGCLLLTVISCFLRSTTALPQPPRGYRNDYNSHRYSSYADDDSDAYSDASSVSYMEADEISYAGSSYGGSDRSSSDGGDTIIDENRRTGGGRERNSNGGHVESDGSTASSLGFRSATPEDIAKHEPGEKQGRTSGKVPEWIPWCNNIGFTTVKRFIKDKDPHITSWQSACRQCECDDNGELGDCEQGGYDHTQVAPDEICRDIRRGDCQCISLSEFQAIILPALKVIKKIGIEALTWITDPDVRQPSSGLRKDDTPPATKKIPPGALWAYQKCPSWLYDLGVSHWPHPESRKRASADPPKKPKGNYRDLREQYRHNTPPAAPNPPNLDGKMASDSYKKPKGNDRDLREQYRDKVPPVAPNPPNYDDKTASTWKNGQDTRRQSSDFQKSPSQGNGAYQGTTRNGARRNSYQGARKPAQPSSWEPPITPDVKYVPAEPPQPPQPPRSRPGQRYHGGAPNVHHTRPNQPTYQHAHGYEDYR